MNKALYIVCDYDPLYAHHGSSVISRNLIRSLPKQIVKDVYTVYPDLSFYSNSLVDNLQSIQPYRFPNLSKLSSIILFITSMLSFLPIPCARINQFFFKGELSRIKKQNLSTDKVRFILVGPSLFPLVKLIRKKIPRCSIYFIPYDSVPLTCINAIRSRVFLVRVFSAIKSLPWFLAESNFTKYANKVIYVTEQDASFARKLSRFGNPHNISFVPNGVDTNHFLYQKPTLNPYYDLLISGNLSNPPFVSSVTWFIHTVFSCFFCSTIRLRLVIAGANPTDELMNICHDYDNIHLHPSVPDLRYYYYNSRVFIAPHTSGSGIKNSVLQAMSCGIPVVSTSLGISGLSIKDNLHALVALDAREFVAHINLLCNNYSKRTSLSQNARSYIEAVHSWQSFADVLM